MRKYLSLLLLFTAATTLGWTPLPQGPLTGGAPSLGGRGGTVNTEIVGGLGGPRDIVVSVKQTSRPLMEVARLISEQLHVSVSYEEPAWVGGADMTRAVVLNPKLLDNRRLTAKERADLEKELEPALGSIDARAILRDGDDESKLAARLLQECLDDNAQRKNSGLFKLVKIGDAAYSIVGTNMRGENGEWLSASSPLDIRISFPEESRTESATLILIARAVSDAIHQRIQVNDEVVLGGVFPMQSSNQIRLGANNEIARDVLGRMLIDVSQRLNKDRGRRHVDSNNQWMAEPEQSVGWNLLFTKTWTTTAPSYFLKLDVVSKTVR